jgi:hypothetical protein
VRVVDIQGVQSHLIAEQAELIEQAIGAPLRGRRSRPQDPEVGMIQSFSLSIQVRVGHNYHGPQLLYNVGFYVTEEKYWG